MRLVVVAAYVAFIHTAWLLTGGSGIFHGELVDGDSYMRLVRIQQLVETANWFDSSIPRTNAPDGGTLHWTRLFDVVLLALAMPFVPFFGFGKALFIAGAAVGPLLHVISAVALAWAATPLLGRVGAGIAGALTAAQPGFLSFAVAGHADHHVLYALITILAFGFVIRALSSANDGERYAFGAGIFVAIGLWVGMEMIIFMIIVVVATSLPWLFGERRGAAVSLRFAFGMMLALVAVLLVEQGPARFLVVEYDRVSIVHLTMAALLLAFWVAVRTWQGNSFAVRLSVGLVAVAIAFLCLKFLFPEISEGALAGADPETIRFIKMPSEFGSIRDIPHFLLFLGGTLFAVPWMFWRGAREWIGADRWGWVLATLCVVFYSVLAVFWLRSTLYAGLFLALPLAGLAVAANAAITRRIKGLRRIPVKVAVILLLLVGPNAAGIAWTVAGKDGGDRSRIVECPLAPMADFLNKSPWGENSRTILASANFGPELLYRTDHKVMATHHHRNVAGIFNSTRILGASSEAESLRLVRLHRVDLILLCPGSSNDGYFLWDGGDMYKRLVNGVPPNWLREVKTSSRLGKSFRLFSVVP